MRDCIDLPIVVGWGINPNSCKIISCLLKGKVVLPGKVTGDQSYFQAIIKHYSSLLVGIGDRNILKTHHTGVGSHRERAREVFLDGTHVIDVNLVTFHTSALPVTGIVTM